MVSINGVSLKKEKLVYVYGVDVLSADVYLDGKKLGNWCEDTDGGEDRFNFKISKREFSVIQLPR